MRTKQNGFTMIAVLLAVIITLLFLVPLYLTRIKSAQEEKERAKEQVEKVEKQVEEQMNTLEEKMNSSLEKQIK